MDERKLRISRRDKIRNDVVRGRSRRSGQNSTQTGIMGGSERLPARVLHCHVTGRGIQVDAHA